MPKANQRVGDIFKILFCTCALTLGWIVATQPGMILQKVGYWANRMADKYKIFELLICPWCSSSAFVFPAYAICFLSGEVEFRWGIFLFHPVLMGASSLIDGMIWTLYQLMSEKIGFIKDQRENGESSINS